MATGRVQSVRGTTMKKLYEVSAELTLYVLAEDDDAAAGEAHLHASEEVDNLLPGDFTASRVTSLPADCEDAYPYTDSEDWEDLRTLGQIFEAEKAAEKAERSRIEFEERQLKLFS